MDETSKVFPEGNVVSEKVDTSTWVDLPEEITLNELRSELLSNQLLVSWERQDPENTEPIRFEFDSTWYELFPGVKYVVDAGGSVKGMLYLNPLTPTAGVPEESNIPLEADEDFSRVSVRNEGDFKIVVTSPDGDVLKAIDGVLESRKQRGYTDEFYADVEKLGTGGLEKLVQERIAASDLGKITQGKGVSIHLLDLVTAQAQDRYVEARKNGEDLIPSRGLIEQATDEFLDWISAEVLVEVEELRQRYSDEGSLSFKFSDYFWDKSDPNSRSIVVSTYVPETGWSIAVPRMNCPAQAARAVESWMVGNGGDYPTLSQSADDALAEGFLGIDRDHREIVCRNLERLEPSRAVYHGDDTIVHALEALRGMGDPVLGEQFFDFKQILFFDVVENSDQSQQDKRIKFG